MRRYAHAAGASWRKWEPPITHFRRARAWTVLFWVACAEAGAVAALVLFR